MKDKEHRDIDSIFKQALEDPAAEAGYREKDWSAMERMLDADRKPRRVVLWLPLAFSAAAMTLIVLGWWAMHPSVTSTKKSEQPLSVNKMKATATPPQETKGAATVDRKALAMVNSVQPSGTALPLQAGSNTNGLTPTGTLANEFSISLPNDSMVAVKRVNGLPALITQAERGDLLTLHYGGLPELKGADTAKALAMVDVMSDVKPSTAKKVTVAKTTPILLRPQLALTVLASSDINGSGSFKSAGTGKNFGLLFSVRFNKLAISTGATYTVKPYSVPFSAYTPNSTYKFKYDPESVMADCRMIDIPLNIDYRIYSKNRNSFTVGTGLTSYIMTTERFTYNYDNPNASPANYQVNKPGKYLFSALNLQVNYQRQVSSKVGVNIQPFMKLPISRIGYSQVRLQTVGVAIGLNWNLNKLSSPK